MNAESYPGTIEGASSFAQSVVRGVGWLVEPGPLGQPNEGRDWPTPHSIDLLPTPVPRLFHSFIVKKSALSKAEGGGKPLNLSASISTTMGAPPSARFCFCA